MCPCETNATFGKEDIRELKWLGFVLCFSCTDWNTVCNVFSSEQFLLPYCIPTAYHTVLYLVITGLSILQNGQIPQFLREDNLQEIFFSDHPSECLLQLRNGLAEMGIYQVFIKTKKYFHLILTGGKAQSACSKFKMVLIHFRLPESFPCSCTFYDLILQVS